MQVTGYVRTALRPLSFLSLANGRRLPAAMVSSFCSRFAVKVAHRGGRVLNAAPEYEDCARVARSNGIPLKTVYQHAVAAYLATREDG